MSMFLALILLPSLETVLAESYSLPLVSICSNEKLLEIEEYVVEPTASLLGIRIDDGIPRSYLLENFNSDDQVFIGPFEVQKKETELESALEERSRRINITYHYKAKNIQFLYSIQRELLFENLVDKLKQSDEFISKEDLLHFEDTVRKTLGSGLLLYGIDNPGELPEGEQGVRASKVNVLQCQRVFSDDQRFQELADRVFEGERNRK